MSTFVPDIKDQSAAYRIFHWYYLAFIPQHATYSKDYLTNFGIGTTQNREIDRELAKSLTLAQLTISDMAEHLDNGINIQLEDPKKSVEIYKTVREHLLDWEKLVQESIGDVDPPMEDLRKLDLLASELYKVAKGYMQIAPSDSKLFQTIERLGSRRVMSRITAAEQVKRAPLPEDYQSITDKIAKEAFAKSRRWR
jgi:hypothetical protein